MKILIHYILLPVFLVVWTITMLGIVLALTQKSRPAAYPASGPAESNTRDAQAASGGGLPPTYRPASPPAHTPPDPLDLFEAPSPGQTPVPVGLLLRAADSNRPRPYIRVEDLPNDPNWRSSSIRGRGPDRVPYLVAHAQDTLWKVTAYTAGPESTGKRPGDPGYGITASGRPAVFGMCAADRSIPFGTVLFIPGYGYAVVADRGGAIKGRHLDVFIPNLSSANAWGVRRLPIGVLP